MCVCVGKCKGMWGTQGYTHGAERASRGMYKAILRQFYIFKCNSRYFEPAWSQPA